MTSNLKYCVVAFLVFMSTASQAQFEKFLKKTDSTIRAREMEDSLRQAQQHTPQPSGKPNPTPASQEPAQVSQATQVQRGPQPTEHEMQGGIKEALQQALQSGISKVSATDGFFKDAAIKLLFPPEARKAEATLRNLGLGSLCDKVILQMNRAAEDASKKAAPVFLRALKQMSIRDAAGILAGAPNSATAYFQSHTTAELGKTFKPVIDSSLKKLHASALYASAVKQYNTFPLATSKVDPDLSNYATGQAIQGLFTTLALEETKLRAKSGLNASPLVRKVFGYFNK